MIVVGQQQRRGKELVLNPDVLMAGYVYGQTGLNNVTVVRTGIRLSVAATSVGRHDLIV